MGISSSEDSLAGEASNVRACTDTASDPTIELAELAPLPASQTGASSPTLLDVRSTSSPAEDPRTGLTFSSNLISPSTSAQVQAGNSSSKLLSPSSQASSLPGTTTREGTTSLQPSTPNLASSPQPPPYPPKSSRWTQIKRGLISERLESVLMLVVALGGWLTAIVALLPSFASNEMAEWTAAKDFREQCRQDKEMNLSTPACDSALKRVLPYPPHVSKNIFKDLGKRWLDKAHKTSTYSKVHSIDGASTSFLVLLGIFTVCGLLLAVLVLRKWARVFQAWNLRIPFSGNSRVNNEGHGSMLPSFEAVSSSESRSTAMSLNPVALTSGSATLRSRRDGRKAPIPHLNLAEASAAGDRHDVERRLMDRSLGAGEKCDALVAAAGNNDLDMVELLLAQKLDLNAATGENGESTLIRVVGVTSNWTIIRQLLDLGGNIGIADNGKPQTLNCSILHKAATLGGNEVVLRMLLKKVDVNYRSPRGWAALHVAAGRAKPDVIKILLEGGADVHNPTRLGLLPLHVAIRTDPLVNIQESLKRLKPGADFDRRSRGLADMSASIRRDKEVVIRLLLDHGAHVDAVDKNHWTALHHASALGDVHAIEFLVEHGASLELEDKGYNQALHFAVMESHKAAVITLLNLKASANRAEGIPFTAFELALHYAHGDIIHLLLDEIPQPPSTGKLSRGLLRERIYKCAAVIFRYWTEAGTDVMIEQTKGTTWLHIISPWTTCTEGKQLFKLLLEQKPHLECRNSQGRTPLIEAAIQSHDHSVQLLLQYGANTEARDESGQTSLHRAARAGNEYTVEQLLFHNADVNAQDNDGMTALIGMATSWKPHQYTFVLQKLLRETNIHLKTLEGKTALHYAMCYPINSSISRLILNQGGDLGAQCNNGIAPIHCYAAHDDRGMTLPLWQVSYKANINIQCFDGPLRLYGPGPISEIGAHTIAYRGRDTPLHVAVRSRRGRKVEELLSWGGANGDIQNQLGHTPLHLAMFCDGSTIRLLLLKHYPRAESERDAEPMHRDNEELAAIEDFMDPTKASRDNEITEKIVDILLRFKVNMDIQSNNGNTPLHLAARFGHLNRCQLLLKNGAKTDILNSSGRTAMQEAQHFSEYSAAELINSQNTAPILTQGGSSVVSYQS